MVQTVLVNAEEIFYLPLLFSALVHTALTSLSPAATPAALPSSPPPLAPS